MTTLSQSQNLGFEVSLHGTESIMIAPASKLNQQQRIDIKRYRLEIIKCLKAANDEKPKRALQKGFPNREI